MIGKSLTLSAVAAVAGCAGLSHTVDRDLLEGLSIGNRLLLFDAENDVMIAVDEMESIKRDIRHRKEDLAIAQARAADVVSDRLRAEEKGDMKAAELAKMAKTVFDKKVEYIEASVDLLRDRLEAQEEFLLMAQAKYELAKAKTVIRSNAEGSTELVLEDFTEQVDDMAEEAREAQEELDEAQKSVDALKEAWLQERKKLQQASGGGLGSPWVEDSMLWGEQ